MRTWGRRAGIRCGFKRPQQPRRRRRRPRCRARAACGGIKEGRPRGVPRARAGAGRAVQVPSLGRGQGVLLGVPMFWLLPVLLTLLLWQRGAACGQAPWRWAWAFRRRVCRLRPLPAHLIGWLLLLLPRRCIVPEDGYNHRSGVQRPAFHHRRRQRTRAPSKCTALGPWAAGGARRTAGGAAAGAAGGGATSKARGPWAWQVAREGPELVAGAWASADGAACRKPPGAPGRQLAPGCEGQSW
jgi:hypothetical protein